MMFATLAALGIGGFVILVGWLWRADGRAAKREAGGDSSYMPVMADTSLGADANGDCGASGSDACDSGGGDGGGGGGD